MSDVTPSGNASSLPASPSLRERLRLELMRPSTRRVALVLGLWAICAVMYWPSVRALNALWTSPAQEEAYTHGYLILLISLWLTVRDRKRLAAEPRTPLTPAALGALLLLSALWLWAWRAAIQVLHMMLLPLILFTAIAAALGWRAARTQAFPIGYLYFALPFWSSINFIFQAMSAKVTGALMWLTGIAGYMRGDLIHLAGGTVRIAGDCSGLHEFIVGLALAALYCKLFELPRRESLLAIGLMGVLATVVNWIRIFAVVVAAYTTDMHSSLVRNHYWLGWWLFAIVFAGYLWWMGRMPAPAARTAAPAAAEPASAEPAAPRAARPGLSLTKVLALSAWAAFIIIFWLWVRSSLANREYWVSWSLSAGGLAALLGWIVHRRAARRSLRQRPPAQPPDEAVTASGDALASVLVTVLVLALLPASAYAMDWAAARAPTHLAINWPSAPSGWEGPQRAYATEWHPYFRRATAQSLRQYTTAGGATVQVFVVAYHRQTQHAKLLSYWNNLLGRTGDLRPEVRHIVDAPSGRWRETRVIDAAGLRSLIWSRDLIGDRVFIDPRLSQVWYGLRALIHPPLSSLEALRTDCQPSCRAARARLAAAAQHLLPALRRDDRAERSRPAG